MNSKSKLLHTCVLLLSILCHLDLAAQEYQRAKKMGAISGDVGNSIAVDHLGNVYVTGHFQSTVDFDPGPEIHSLTSVGDTDAFFAKYDANGNYIFAKSIGSTGYDYGYGIATDASGNVYVTGTFDYTADFDPSVEIYNLTATVFDIFFAKYDTDGNFIYAKRMGSSFNDKVFDIATDIMGNIYLTGHYEGNMDADPGPDIHNLIYTGSQDLFFAKYDTDGNYVYAHNISGAGYDRGNGIASDSEGNAYVIGYFEQTADFDPSEDTHELTSNGNSDIFFAKYDADGNYVFAKSIGGTSYDRGYNIHADAEGDVYISGWFGATADFDPGAETQNLTSAGGDDLFIAKYDADGNYIYARSMGGQFMQQCNDMAVDATGNVFITGWHQGSADFDPGAGTQQITASGSYDGFIAKYDSDGNYVYAKTFGGLSMDKGNCMVLDESGYIYLTGSFEQTADFDFGPSTQNLVTAGNADAFIAKYLDTAPTSTDEFKQQNTFSIYPNPAKDNISIVGIKGYADIKVFDSMGKMVLNQRLVNNGQLSLSQLDAGVYTVTIETTNTKETKKMMVVR